MKVCTILCAVCRPTRRMHGRQSMTVRAPMEPTQSRRQPVGSMAILAAAVGVVAAAWFLPVRAQEGTEKGFVGGIPGSYGTAAQGKRGEAAFAKARCGRCHEIDPKVKK